MCAAGTFFRFLEGDARDVALGALAQSVEDAKARWTAEHDAIDAERADFLTADA